MKKIILVGHVACGKTTLCQRLNDMEMKYKKTQALEVIHKTIDTPGEYVERRSLFHALVVTSVEADQVLAWVPASSSTLPLVFFSSTLLGDIPSSENSLFSFFCP